MTILDSLFNIIFIFTLTAISHTVHTFVSVRTPECAKFTNVHSRFANQIEIRNSPVTNISDLQEIGFNTDQFTKNLLIETFMTVPEIIKKNGYPVEVHTVTTKDEYILELHRIPYSPKSRRKNERKTAVLLMHGLMESSAGWVIMGPEKGLAFILADAGYDVWLGNARGTRYSRRHIKYSPTGIRKSKFWSFSWHEIGILDTTSIFHYLFLIANIPKLHYIGHSQGTTAFFVMASELPEYNKRIISMQALAPVAYLNNLSERTYIQFLVKYYELLRKLIRSFGVDEFAINNKFLAKFSELACKNVESSTPILCKNLLFLLDGYDSNKINCTMLPVIFGHTPAGASIRQFMHYAQLIRSGRFQKFDHESIAMNMKSYGTPKPPAYNISNIRAPVYLYYSPLDATATQENVLALRKQLPNVKGLYEVQNYTHVDFIYSVNVKKALYNKLVWLMKDIDSKQ